MFNEIQILIVLQLCRLKPRSVSLDLSMSISLLLFQTLVIANYLDYTFSQLDVLRLGIVGASCFSVVCLIVFACYIQPKEYMDVAEKAAYFIRKHLYNEQTRRLQHSFRNGPSKAPGFLDDYAFLIAGLLDLYEFGGSVFWLGWALELQETQVKKIWDLLMDGTSSYYC